MLLHLNGLILNKKSINLIPLLLSNTLKGLESTFTHTCSYSCSYVSTISLSLSNYFTHTVFLFLSLTHTQTQTLTSLLSTHCFMRSLILTHCISDTNTVRAPTLHYLCHIDKYSNALYVNIQRGTQTQYARPQTNKHL